MYTPGCTLVERIRFYDSSDKRARPFFSNQSERTRNNVQFSFKLLKLPHGNDKNEDAIRGPQASKLDTSLHGEKILNVLENRIAC